jgi:hypothetical protein
MTKRNVSARFRRTPRNAQRRRKLLLASLSLMLLTLIVSGLQLPSKVGAQGDGERGARNAGVRPKRPTARTAPASSAPAAPKGNFKTARISDGAEAGVSAESLSPILAAADFDLIGLAVTASPATQSVPKNTPTAVLVAPQVPEGTDVAQIVAGMNPLYRVRGELTGPSFSNPVTLEGPIGQPLAIPAMSQAGDHMLQNLRVVDTGTDGQPVVAAVTPDSCGIVVFERILISEVHVNELTFDEIRQAGIVLTDDSYQAFNFTLGIGTTSDAQQISIPVAFPTVGITDPRPIVGTPTISGPGIDLPTFVPIMLTEGGGDDEGGGPRKAPDFGGEPVRIPGVVVFPGRVGFLHQFFEAIVIVANGAPNGAPLVLRQLHAKAKLPDNGTPANPSDDPLRIAETQTGGRVFELDLHGLGADAKYGTPDDTDSFSPGQSGQATFLLEGMKEGLHTINFDLSASLEGLPSGPVTVTGQVPGAVLVRDVSFAVTFTHPNIVRAGQEYDLAMTMYNSGSRNITGAFAQLPSNSVSGASFIGQDTGARQFQETIKVGESATVKWRLRAHVTGAVTASYVKVGEDISAGLRLITGVGDRNVPLSPESLILPDPVKHLPPSVVEAGRELLGQAWSVANAPPGSLPRGVQPIGKQVVVDRAVEMGIAGMRVDFKEAKSVSVGTLMRDWLGELQETPDEGFADAMRNTPSGFVWYDSIGAEFYKRLTGATPASASALHLEFANAEMPRSQFISALVTHADGARVAGARFADAQGAKIGFGATAAERFGDSQTGASLSLDAVNALDGVHTTSVGQMLAVSEPAAGQWTLELDGWQQGSVDISLLMPATSRTFQHLTWSGVQIAAGGKYRVNFRPLNANATPVLEELRGGTWQALGVAPQVSTLNQPSPRVVGVIQVTNEVVPGGDKYGRLIGVLFSKPMSKESSETVSRYAVGGGALKGSNPAEQVGGPIKVTGAKLDYGSRFVFLGLNSTIGPYIDRDLTVTGVYDERRMPISPSPATSPIEARVSPQGIPPGAYLTGRVMNADGTPVANAQVIYWFQECPDPSFLALPPPPIPIAIRNTDAQGRYSIDYVRDGDCGPLSVTVNNPTTHSEKRLTSPVAYDGQHMVFDMVFLARGGVQGTVTVGGRPAPNTFVRIVPALDVIGTKVVQTDDLGRYAATDIPVGTVSVSAVGTGTLSTSSGLAAGTIEGPNQTAIINVSLQDTQGSVSGRVVHPDGSPSVGSLVVAYERIPGFSTLRPDGATAVGYAFTDRDGGFKISNLLLGTVSLEVTDYVTARFVTQSVLLSPSTPQVNGLLLTLPGSGSVTGRVTDETGAAVAGAIVSAAGRAVRTDASGIYTLRELPVGTAQVSAISAETGMAGSARAVVQIGQTTTDVNITILRPAKLQGRVLLVEEGTTTPKPLAGARVTVDGLTIVDTDGQGRYTLENVEPNTNHLLRIVHVGKKLGVNMPVIFSPGETLTRDATFRPGSIHGRVYQPDGVTPVLAQVTIYSPVPLTTEGPDFGMLSSGDAPLTAQTAADGTYVVHGLNPGTFRVSSSNVFFPTRVSEGGVLAPGGNAECNLTLVSTLTGKIQGRIFQPDGTTPAGAGIRVSLTGGSLAEVTVRTDDTGHYEFAEVFSAGSYSLTATDPVTGNSNRLNIQVSKNKDAFFDIRLLGTGGLRVRVIDGGGNPVRSGNIRIDGTEYPFAHRFAEITPDVNGAIQFDNLPEGSYAVSASERGLGGRVEATVPVGSVVETTIQLQASGAVQGKVFMPGGTIPIGLADVQLKLGGRSVGFNVTQDDDTNRGSFSFLNVPTGDFTLDVFDNRTGRVGRSAGRVTSQNEVVTVNVELLPVGAVAGRVTANGNPVDHALVHISADGSGIRGASIYATTDPDGRYRFTGIPAGRFTVTVSDAPGGQTGAASGTVAGNVEPLADTILDIALEPSQTVTGTVYQAGSTSEVVPGARVTIMVGGRVYRTSTNVNGVYRLEFVALGQVRVRAEAPTGFDRGEAALVAGTQQGATVTSNVTLAGTGTITGNVLNHDGTPLTIGTITFTNDEWGGTPLSIITGVQSNGRYTIAGAPAGAFALKLAVTGRVEVGSASGVGLAGQTVELPIRLEDAGRVTGTVKTDDGSAPVTGADVVLFLNRASGGSLRFYTHTDAAGVWRFDNVPLGTLSVTVMDIPTGGLARAFGALTANGQVLDTGEVNIDATPIRVESVTPANGTTGVTNNAPEITVTFSEPANAGTLNGTVQLRSGSNSISASQTPAADGRSIKLKPTSRLTDSQTYSVVVTTGLQDLVGHHLASEFRSTFVTADQTAPTVASISPANGAERVAPTTGILVNFNEPLDATQDLSNVVSLTSSSKEGPAVAGASTLAADGRSITFHPAAALEEGTRYTVVVTGQRDASGNTQTAGFTSIFSTVDQSPPVIDPLPINGQRVRSFRPVITATYRDNLSGVKVSSVVLRLDGADVTAGATVTGTSLTYTPPAPLARGAHNVSLQAADNDGNLSAAQTATFEIDDSGAIITSFTIAGAPATDGMFVTSTLQPVIAVTYNDDTGADRSGTRLLLGFNGQAPQPVAANVTDNTLSYQSPTPMQEGRYTVEAIIVNNLGTSTSTGRINFTLDVDAPQIATINPSTGTQHGGTTVTITGERLLNSVPPTTGAGTGLLGDYYYNTDFTDLTFQRVAPTINFDWGSQSPDPSLRPQKHSIRWSGQIVPRYSETYTFGLSTATAVKLTIDDQVVIDKHGESGFIEYTGQINLVAGQRYNVRIDYYQVAFNSAVKFNWSSASQAKEIVPASQLYPNASAPVVTFGGNVAKMISATSGTPDTVVVETPAGAPGVTEVELTTDRGRGLVAGGFNYEADARTPLMPEPDTLALWHLDETGNGAVPIIDASGILNATSASTSTVQPGRFVRGRARANIASGQDIENVLALGTKSFTVETWIKTAPVERTYTLVGKDHPSAGGANYTVSDFTFQILPSGGLRGIVHDTNGTQWKVELPAATLRVDDNQWHYLSMVVNRELSRLSIYVDGVERAFIGTGGMQPVINFNNYPLRAGHYDSGGPSTPGTSAPTEFPGTLDEIRLSSTAHSETAIRQTYLGTEGTLGLVVLKSTPYALARGTTVQMDVSGYNLSHVTATVTDSAGTLQPTRTLSSSANRARLEIAVAPAAALGNAQLVLSSSAGTVTRSLIVVELGQSVYGVEPDTRLLWHMDEQSDRRLIDASTYSIDGTADVQSIITAGRFGQGRKRANIAADQDNSLLLFGTSSFTVEAWMKTSPVERTYTIVGKDHPSAGGANYTVSDFTLQLTPAGGLRAIVHDTNGTQWKAQMAATVYDVDDDQWHAVAMVVNREHARLSIYVDGVERAFIGTGGMQPVINFNNYPLRAGHYDSGGPSISGTSAPTEFPGTLDEIRVSSTAHTAARIRADFEGNSGLFITSAAPREVKRNKTSAQRTVTTVNVEGYDLSGVSARVERQGELLDINVNVAESTYRSARFDLAVAPTVHLGQAKLVLSKPGQPDAFADIYISETSEFVVDNDTVVLWHLNETTDGNVTILDSGALSIDGRADTNSKAAPGHFLGGRNRASIVADTDFNALLFGTKSFTVETWVKTAPVERTYTLVGKDHPSAGGANYTVSDFTLQLTPSGSIRGIVHDTNGTQWKAEMGPTIYDIDNDQWHHVAMVVSREHARLSIYVDGVERAFIGTGGMQPVINFNNYPLRAGHYDSGGPSTPGTSAPTEFPGTLDEIRVSSTAHSAERVASDAIGYDVIRLTRIQPISLQRGTVSVPVIITGNGLTDATLTTNRPEVGVSIVSTTATRIDALVTVPGTSALGTLTFTATDSLNQSLSISNEIVDQKPFVNSTTDNNATLALWHLDEETVGAVPFAGSGDAVPTIIGGTPSSASTFADGRFGKGRTLAGIAGSTQSGTINFGTSSFTVECWMKTGAIERTYTLVGKDHPSAGGANYTVSDFTLQITPAGGLRAIVHDTNGTQWKAEMGPRIYDPATGQWLVTLDDNRWHYVVMVLNRSHARLSVYIDGVERAFVGTGGMQPVINFNNYPFRAGHYDSGGPVVAGTNAPTNFPGTLDEIRILLSARTAEEIRQTWTGAETTGSAAPFAAAAAMSAERVKERQAEIQVTSVSPMLVARDKASSKPQVTTVKVEGRMLDGVSARVMRDGQPLDVSATVEASAERELSLKLAVAPSAPLGVAQLVLSKQGVADKTVALRIVEQSEFAVEADTLALWHLDENGNGATRLSDAGPHSLEATPSADSQTQAGRFKAGRARLGATASTSAVAPLFGTQSFTVESWIKTAPLAQDYLLAGKRGPEGGADWTWEMLASGVLRARLYDTNGNQWQVEMPREIAELTDNQWHSLALVVDREAKRLAFYVDGRERASALMPETFGELRNLGSVLQVGHAGTNAGAGEGTPEFPGVIDEVRISSTAHSAEKIANDFEGHDAPQVTSVGAPDVPKGVASIPVTLNGYGLAGTTVTTAQAGVRLAVTQSTSTQLNLLVSIPQTATAGALRLDVSDALKRTTAVELNVVERTAWERARGNRPASASSRVEPESQPAKPAPPRTDSRTASSIAAESGAGAGGDRR